MGKIALLLLILLLMAAAWYPRQLMKRYIDPRRSFGHFLLFVGLHLLLVFVLSLVAGLVIFQYKEFFFKG
jgi:hypothetical protein